MKKQVTLVLDDALWQQVKVLCAKRGITMRDFVADALRAATQGVDNKRN